jgi:hypothetical protein
VLEDMHDENVIARNDLLFFIDTVFYVMKKWCVLTKKPATSVCYGLPS